MLCPLYSYSEFAFFAAFLWRLTLALELSHRAGSGQSLKKDPTTHLIRLAGR
jgi:hypothetical protein